MRIRNAPANYLRLVSPRPNNVTISRSITKGIDIWHLFTKTAAELKAQLPKLIKAIQPNGMIWVSWPKKSSGVASDLLENDIRRAALSLGLVDVKVCAVDEVWSGLKLVIRKENRKAKD